MKFIFLCAAITACTPSAERPAEINSQLPEQGTPQSDVTSDGTSATGDTSLGTGDSRTTTDSTLDTGTQPSTGTATGDPGTVPDLVTWEVGEEVVCDDPSRRAEARWDVELLGHHEVLHVYHWGGGVTLHDFDRDGSLELIRTTETGIVLYTRGVKGWIDVTAQRVPDLPSLKVAGATAADIDGDDDLDLVLTPWLGRVHVLRNDGTGHFEDVTEGSGLHSDAWRHQTATFGDLDSDGDLDLFIGGYGDSPPSLDGITVDPSRLYLNRGDGTFSDATELLPPDIHGGYTFQGSFVDANADGLEDLLVLNDFFYHLPNQFLVNNGDAGFTHDEQAGFGDSITGMGLEIGELNGDGLPDYLMTGYQEVGLLLSFRMPDDRVTFIRSDGAWGLITDPRAPLYQEFAWGVQLADLDNDGAEEIFVSFGDATDPMQYALGRLHWRSHTDMLWVEHPAGVWTDRALEWDVADEGVSRGVRVADWNDDGWLDMIHAELNGPTWIRTARCGEGRWSKVTLHDERTPNRDAVGATIEVLGPVRSWKEWVTSGATSMYSDGPFERHFGLGDLLTVDIEVVWPDGEVTLLEDMSTNRSVAITRH